MDSKIKCIIVDDEPLAVGLLRSYVERTDTLSLAGAYTDAAAAAESITRGDADLAFLDINMPRIGGLGLADLARSHGVRVVFVTAYRDYAVEGFRLNALDYLLKPVSYDEFMEAVARAIHTIAPSRPATYITVRSDYRNIRVDHADILYIEGLKDYVKIYMTGRLVPVITQMSLKAIEQALPDDTFVRVHRSYIIAMQHVVSYDRNAVIIADRSIPVSDTYRSAFLARIAP